MDEDFRLHLLGRVFRATYCWKQPDVVQVVGWTKNSIKEGTKVRYVYVRHIGFNVNQNDLYGGNGTIDWNSVQSDIKEPVYRSAKGLVLLKININDKYDEGGGGDGGDEESTKFFLSKGSPSSSIYEYYSDCTNQKRDFRYTWTSLG